MNTRERWLAAVNRQQTDQLLFWPKLDRAYVHRYGGRHHFDTADQFHAYLGSEVLRAVPSCLHQRNSK